ncbi:MAG TPA: hypothetical protein VED46_07220 [Alphaproteobacteria bacterium]|nr:hypothetical protein [Alphaproteobacteria bacterium]
MIRPDMPERALRLGYWMLLAVLAGAGARYALAKSMHHDVAYYVNAVGRWLDGAHLYRDLIDVNVPTIYWLMSIPVWMARQLDLDPMALFNWFALALAAVSVLSVWHAANRILRMPGWIPDALAGVLLLCFVVFVGHNFGQREHLAAILLAPYAVCRAGMAPDRPGIGFRIAVGLAAGLGTALKPHFALIVLGLEAGLLLRRGWRWTLTSESAALLIAGTACAIATLLFVPDYLDRILPLARAVYHGFEWPLVDIVTTLGKTAIGCFVMAVLAIPAAWMLERRAGDLVAVLAGAGLGGFASFLMQSKGWIYQLTPSLTFSVAAFVVAAAGCAQAGLAGRYRRPILAIIAIVSGLGFAAGILDLARSGRTDHAIRDGYASVVDAIRIHAVAGPALFISLDVDYTFPGVDYAGATYPYRWHHLLPLPGLYSGFVQGEGNRPFRSPEEMSGLERDFFVSFIEDAVNHPPRIVLVDRRRPIRPGLAPDLDLFAYFCQSPRFAQLMSGYEWLGARSHYDVLVARRTPATDAGPCATPPLEIDAGEPSS